MKRKVVALFMAALMGTFCMTGCGNGEEAVTESAVEESSEVEEDTTQNETEDTAETENEADEETEADADQTAADEVAALIDAIYVQERTDETDKQCSDAKAAWDALTDAQKELVAGENADPDYFGRDTGDASKDDPRNKDDIGENEILVVSFGTSFNDSRVADVKGIEDALQEANPDWSVRRAFTAQIIINHVQARDGENIDNVDQALERAVANGVKNLRDTDGVYLPFCDTFELDIDEDTDFINPCCEERFERLVREVIKDLQLKEPDESTSVDEIFDKKVYEEYWEECNEGGHKVGGYPMFCQGDARDRSDEFKDHDVLLLQIDTDEGIMWGDSGVANFFIKREDLRNLDFSNVFYTWDCC